MNCWICEKPLKKVLELKRSKVFHARHFYSCGEHLYFKFFGSASSEDKENIRMLHFLDIKGISLSDFEINKCNVEECGIKYHPLSTKGLAPMSG